VTTAIYNLAMSIPSRIGELNRLVAQASECEKSDEVLYNALCRAISVLLTSHLEGFLKDLTDAIIADLNEKLVKFEKMPRALQRAFCKQIVSYEGVSGKDIDTRVEQLIQFFTKYSVPIEHGAFSYREAENKNSSVAVIESAFAKLGIPDIISSIANSRFEVVFDNDSQTNVRLLRDLKRMRVFLVRFPHRKLPKHYTPKMRQKIDKKATLWHLFIEEILVRRHNVAHGNTLENETTWRDLKMDILKLEVLVQGVLYSAVSYLHFDTDDKNTNE